MQLTGDPPSLMTVPRGLLLRRHNVQVPSRPEGHGQLLRLLWRPGASLWMGWGRTRSGSGTMFLTGFGQCLVSWLATGAVRRPELPRQVPVPPGSEAGFHGAHDGQLSVHRSKCHVSGGSVWVLLGGEAPGCLRVRCLHFIHPPQPPRRSVHLPRGAPADRWQVPLSCGLEALA